jgi:hypothetical protein
MSVPDMGENSSHTNLTACSFNYNNVFGLLHLDTLSGRYQMPIIYTSIHILSGFPEELSIHPLISPVIPLKQWCPFSILHCSILI